MKNDYRSVFALGEILFIGSKAQRSCASHDDEEYLTQRPAGCSLILQLNLVEKRQRIVITGGNFTIVLAGKIFWIHID